MWICFQWETIINLNLIKNLFQDPSKKLLRISIDICWLHFESILLSFLVSCWPYSEPMVRTTFKHLSFLTLPSTSERYLWRCVGHFGAILDGLVGLREASRIWLFQFKTWLWVPYSGLEHVYGCGAGKVRSQLHCYPNYTLSQKEREEHGTPSTDAFSIMHIL